MEPAHASCFPRRRGLRLCPWHRRWLNGISPGRSPPRTRSVAGGGTVWEAGVRLRSLGGVLLLLEGVPPDGASARRVGRGRAIAVRPPAPLTFSSRRITQSARVQGTPREGVGIRFRRPFSSIAFCSEFNQNSKLGAFLDPSLVRMHSLR